MAQEQPQHVPENPGLTFESAGGLAPAYDPIRPAALPRDAEEFVNSLEKGALDLLGVIGSGAAREWWRDQCGKPWQSYYRGSEVSSDTWMPLRREYNAHLPWTELHARILDRLAERMGFRGPYSAPGTRYEYKCAREEFQVIGGGDTGFPEAIARELVDMTSPGAAGRCLPDRPIRLRGPLVAMNEGLWRWYSQFLELHRPTLELWMGWINWSFCKPYAQCLEDSWIADISCDPWSVIGTQNESEWPALFAWADRAVDRWWDYKVRTVGQLPVTLGRAPERVYGRPFVDWLFDTGVHSLRAKVSGGRDDQGRPTRVVVPPPEAPTLIDPDGFEFPDTWWVYALPALRGVFGAGYHRLPVLGVPAAKEPDAVGIQAGRNVRTGAPVIFVYKAVEWRDRWIWYLVGLFNWPGEYELPTHVVPSPTDTPEIPVPPAPRDDPPPAPTGGGGLGPLLLIGAAIASSS